MIVLDTNVLSELTRERPSPRVLHWHGTQEDLFTTAITQAEMFYGLELMPGGRRRRDMWTSLDRIFNDVFAVRILPFDSLAALMYADLAASRKRIGRPIKQPDAQIAAIARSRGAAVATRNTADFEHCGIKVINPWTG
jgi:predicted nucleic acid-binding protein